MSKSKIGLRFGVLAAVAAGGALLAVAQGPAAPMPPPPPEAAEQSMLTLIYNGIEWPAWFIFFGSMVVLTLIVEHFVTVRRSTVAPPEQIEGTRAMIERRQLREAARRLQESNSYFALIMTAALRHARHGFDAMHQAALERSGELSGRMFRKVEYLNIFGNLGPLMGLLGTVWGMIIAFGAMSGAGGEAAAGDLARGISLALVNTLLGLILAVIGLGFFGVCRNRIESLTVHATVEALNLLEYFRTTGAAAGGAARPQRTGPASQPPSKVPQP